MTAPQHQRRKTSEGLWDKKQCSGKRTVWVSCSANNWPFSLPGPRVGLNVCEAEDLRWVQSPQTSLLCGSLAP